MLIKPNSPRQGITKIQDIQMFLEAYKLKQITYEICVSSIRKLLGDYKSDRIPKMVQQVYRGVISIPVASCSLEEMYNK